MRHVPSRKAACFSLGDQEYTRGETTAKGMNSCLEMDWFGEGHAAVVNEKRRSELAWEL